MRAKPWILTLSSAALVVVVTELVLARCAPSEYRRPEPRLPEHAWKGLIHRASEVPGLEYEVRPSIVSSDRDVEIRTNSLGMRSPELREPRDPACVRIAVLGDSVAFGMGVPMDGMWSSVALRELAAASPETPFELLNCAVSGYSSRDECVVLEKRALPLEPDLVIVGYYLNDPEPEPIQPLQNYFHEPEWWQHSEILRHLAHARRKLDVRRFGDGDFYRYYHAVNGEPWRGTRAALERMRDLAAGHGVAVMLVISPVMGVADTWSAYPYTAIHAQVCELARALGWTTLDLLTGLCESGLEPPELRLDDHHPNARGHALMGRAIAAELLTQRVLLGRCKAR